MAYRLLALDLDGTLLQPDLSILPQTAAALSALRGRGIIITLATGRAFPSAKKYADLLGIDCPLICYNGAAIKTPGGQVLFEDFLPRRHMDTIISACEARDWYLQLYNNDEIVVAQATRHTLADPDYQNMPCRQAGRLSSASLGPTPKMMTRCSPQETAYLNQFLQEITGGDLYIAGSTPHLVEIMSNNVSKAHALKLLCNHLGLDISQAVVCGDSGNDLEMIGAAGLGCAMANATEAVKAAADYVCSGSNGLGVLEVTEIFFAET